MKNDNVFKLLGAQIDRLTITYDDPEHSKESLAQLIALEELGLHSGIKIKATALYKYSARIPLPVEGKGKPAMLVIEMGPYDPKNSSFRIDLNPARLSMAARETAHWIMNAVIYGGFETALYHGKITRVDLAMDFAGKGLEDVIVEFPKLRRRAVHCRKDGSLQSLHLGLRNSSRVVLYEKDIDGNRILRVERRINPKMHGAVLHALPNPLCGLRINDNTFLQKSWFCGGAVKTFVVASTCGGLKRSLMPYPPQTTVKVTSALGSQKHLLFDAEHVWQNWPDLLAKALDGLLLELPLNFPPGPTGYSNIAA